MTLAQALPNSKLKRLRRTALMCIVCPARVTWLYSRFLGDMQKAIKLNKLPSCRLGACPDVAGQSGSFIPARLFGRPHPVISYARPPYHVGAEREARPHRPCL